jgi:hypothetical protein
MATQASAEDVLNVIVFVPPKSDKKSYGLLQALDVQGGKKGLAEFSAMHAGIDKDFLTRQGMQGKIPELEKFLKDALAQKSKPEAINEKIDKHNAKDGSLGCNIAELFKGKASAEASTDSGFQLNMLNMEMISIPPIKPIKTFLEDCVLSFAEECNEIQHAFSRTPTILSGDIEYGVAFVTTTVMGKTYAAERDAFRVGAELKVSDKGDIIEATGNIAIDRSKKVVSIGSGVVGVLVHFILLVKTKNNPTVRIKESFPVRKSRDENLRYVLGSMTTKIRRKIMGPKRAPVQGLVMTEDYDSTGNYQQHITTLTGLADEQAYTAMDMDVEQTHTASLRILGGSDAKGQDPSGDYGSYFQRSNNVLYHSTIEDLEAICKSIHNDGSVTMGGRIFDGIKPVIKVNFEESLPVVYDRKLSGSPDSGRVPGWVLRAERGGELIMLWKVEQSSGIEQSSAVVTAYQNNWHVRESREYLDAGNKAQIDKFESEGFFQLDPAEADPEEVEIAQLESGSLVMMGRQLLALKQFKGDEVNDITQEPAAASFPTESSETPATVSTTSVGQNIPPVGTNVRAEQTPPRKKSKTEVDS